MVEWNFKLPFTFEIQIAWIIVVLIVGVGLFYYRRYSLLIFLLFLRIGFLLAEKQNQIKPISPEFLDNEVWIQVEIKEVYKPSEKYRKYKAHLLSIDSISQENTPLLLYWKKENPSLHPSDQVWLNTKIQTSPKPLNPYQFDYSKYLKRQNIHYVAFSNDEYAQLKVGKSFHHKTSSFKRNIYQKLLAEGYDRHSADIIGAMILGDRTEMDEAVEENYRKTGVVHILSISGLHIMIVYSLFYILLYPIVYLKNGKVIRILISLILIWSYVILVGFQPPVLRSALMISVFHITVTFHRKPNIYHTLTVTALVLLCFNTNFLFDVGFQLSYLAVFFIVYLHPLYQKIFRPKTPFSRLTIGFVGTSISAQLGTFPIAVYYFHQTTGLFLAGNLVMMMASYFMMGGGMLSIILVELGISFPLLTNGFNVFIGWCNYYMEWLSEFDFLVFDRIFFQFWEVLLLLGIALCVKFFYPKPKFNLILAFLMMVLIFQGQRKFRLYKLDQKQEILVFHQYKNSIIGIRNGKNLDVYIRNLEDSTRIKKYIIRPYEINENIQTISLFPMDKEHSSHYSKTKDLIQFGEYRILLAENDLKNIPSGINYLFIQSNAKIKIDSIPEKIEWIVDGSNYPNYLGNGKNPIWKTREKGAKIIRLP